MMQRLVATMAMLVGLSYGALAQQAYPNRIIHLMQGFPLGGNVDIIARIVGHEMEKSLGQSMVVEAKPGLAGALAAETVARSDADGYTLLMLPSAHPAYAALSKNVKFKVVDDFTWISVASFYPFMIAVRADSRFQNLKQIIDEARAKPGELKYGSAGVGSILHTTVELIGSQTKTKFLHIPYRGEAPALTGLLQGEIDFIAATTGPVSPRVKSGEFRALEVISWTGLAGPPNLAKPIVDRLNAELRKALAVPDVKQKLEAMGGDPRATTPDEMKTLVQRQYDTWKKLAVEANLSIN